MNAHKANALSAQYLDALQAINTRLQNIDQIDDLCWALSDWVGEFSAADNCVVYLRVGNVLTQMAALGAKRAAPDVTEIVDRIGLPVGSGIVGAAAQAGEAIYVSDTSADPRYISDVYLGASEFVVPFVYRGDVLGVLDVEHRDVDGIDEEQKRLLMTFALLAAPHIAELLRKPNYQTLNYSEVVAELAHNTIGNGDNLKAIFANITERAARTLRVSRANLWLFEEDPNALVCQDEYSADARAHSDGAQIDMQVIPAYAKALHEERVILANDAHSDPRTRELALCYLAPNDVKSMLDAPIRLDGKVVGVLCLEQLHNAREWTEEEASFVGTLADLATIALASHKKAVAETALIQAQKMESLGRLAGGVAHDFNNLLTVISGAVETIQAKAELDEDNMRLLGLINDASQRAAKLTKNLMAFGGQQQLQLQSLSTRDLLDNLHDLISGIVREDIKVKFVHPPDTAFFVSGDPALLEQVLLNLVINSVDAMPDGGMLTVEVITDRERSDRVGFAIVDTGHGMTQTIKSRMFDPFFTTRKDEGTGLGLSISLGIVHQHGGSLTCTETSQAGTRFELWLPTVQNDPVTSTDVAGATTRSGDETWPGSVLLVEDEAGVREIVSDMLKTLGFDPLVAATPEDALEIMHAQQVDLLISDVVMPGMRGPDLYHAALPENPQLFVIFVSGYTQDILLNVPTTDEQVRYLAKPFTLVQLKEAIEQTRITRQIRG